MGGAEGGPGRGAVRDGAPSARRTEGGGGHRRAAAPRRDVAIAFPALGSVVARGAAARPRVEGGGVGARLAPCPRPRRPRAGGRLSRRRLVAGPSRGGGRQGGAAEARARALPGRGHGTKAVLACEGRGRRRAFERPCGQAAERRAAPARLARLTAPGRVGRVVCDRACSSRPGAGWSRLQEPKPCVPASRTHPPAPHDRSAHARRHRVETLRGRLEAWRAVATRHPKTAASFSGRTSSRRSGGPVA